MQRSALRVTHCEPLELQNIYGVGANVRCDKLLQFHQYFK